MTQPSLAPTVAPYTPDALPREVAVGQKILFVKLAAMGDVAMASALPQTIKAMDASAHVTWLCGRKVAELVRLFPDVDDVWTIDETALLGGSLAARALGVLRVWRLLAGRRFDRVIIGHSDPRYELIAWPARGRRRVLRGVPVGRRMRIPGRWFPDEYARLAFDEPEQGPRERVAGLADLRGRVPDASTALPDIAGRRYAVLVPGGARNVLRDTPQRRWAVEGYVDVARRLAADGITVVLLGDDRDCANLAAFADVPGVVSALGGLSLPQALGVLASADVVVCHDTGPLHLAGLVRARTVALFGPTVPSELVQTEDPRIIALWGGAHLACRPCYDGREVAPCRDNLCMKDISVEAVTCAARELMAREVPAR